MQVSISSKTTPPPPRHDLKGAKILPPGQSLCTKTLPSGENRDSKAPPLWHYLKWKALCSQQIKNGFSMRRMIFSGVGVNESTDRRGCAILALEVVPKNLIFTLKTHPKIYFTRFYACYFSKENYARLLIYQVKLASSLLQVAKSINYEIL